MAVYSIKELEKLSGIKAHTIRIWEKRYQLINPHRTSTNIRYYTDEELRKILNVAVLNRQGIKISNIAKLSDQELREEIARVSRDDLKHESLVDSLVLAMTELDDYKQEAIISRAISKMGLRETVSEVLAPFMEKVGILWQSGNIFPAQEHITSYLIRQKIIAATDQLPALPAEGSRSFLLFLPEDEWHELALLFTQYLLREAGHRVIYLGQSVPYADVLATGATKPFDYILFSSTTPRSMEEFTQFMKDLGGAFPDKTVLCYASFLENQPEGLPSNLQLLGGIEDLTDFISAL